MKVPTDNIPTAMHYIIITPPYMQVSRKCNVTAACSSQPHSAANNVKTFDRDLCSTLPEHSVQLCHGQASYNKLYCISYTQEKSLGAKEAIQFYCMSKMPLYIVFAYIFLFLINRYYTELHPLSNVQNTFENGHVLFYCYPASFSRHK